MSDKKKMAFYASPEIVEKIDQMYKEDGCKSWTEFIEKAVNFYCGYLSAGEYREYLPEVVTAIINGKFDSFENRMAGLLFKIAVELNMMLHVTAANNEIDEEILSELRGLCVNEVKRVQGRVSFEEARKFQKG